jgi:hypothetical protein
VSHLKRHLSVANVISCIALFIALSGAAYAATLGKNAVKTKNIAAGAVTSPKLKSGAVTNPKLRNGTITGAKVAAGAIGSGQLANGSVRSGQLGGGVVTEAKLKNGAVTTNKIGEGAVSNAKLLPSFLAQLVRNVTYVSLASGENAEQTKSVTASCPVGKQAIAGGVRLGGELADVAVTGSTPFVSGSTRTGWSGFAHETGGGPYTDWSIEAFAVCAEL